MHTEFMRGGNAHETMQNSIALGYSELETAMASISVTQLYVFIGMVSAIVFVGLVVFLPILSSIDTASDSIMLQFVNLPPIVRRSLYDQAFRRAKVLRRDFNEDEDDEQAEDDSDEDEAAAAIADEVARAADGGETVNGAAPSESASIDWAAIAAQTAGASLAAQSASPTARGWGAVRSSVGTGDASSRAGTSKRPGKKQLPPYKKSRLSFCVFVARFLGPLLALLVFFATIFGTFMTLENSLQTLTAVATAADNRASCSRSAMVDLRKLEYVVTDAAYIARTFFYVLNSYDCVRQHVRLLTYGLDATTTDSAKSASQWDWANAKYASRAAPVENGAPSVLPRAMSAKVRAALYSNACPFLAEAAAGKGTAFNISSCERFAGGVVKLGLAAVTERVWTAVNFLCDRQIRGIFIQSVPIGVIGGTMWAGNGWSLPQDSFNYSAVVCDDSIGCNMAELERRTVQNGLLEPTATSDPRYIGDSPPSAYPGDGINGLPNNTVPYWIGNELNHPEMELVVLADALYLTPGLMYLAELYTEEASHKIEATLDFYSVFVPVYIVAFCLLMLTYFSSMVTSTNKDIQAKRSMLLYLPVDIVARVRTIWLLIEEIVANSDESGGSGGSGAPNLLALPPPTSRKPAVQDGGTPTSPGGMVGSSRRGGKVAPEGTPAADSDLV
jgi:UPF0716 family protein affecting phage T7 exclusion